MTGCIPGGLPLGNRESRRRAPPQGAGGLEARTKGGPSGRAGMERRTVGVTAADWAGAFLPGAASWSAQGERR